MIFLPFLYIISYFKKIKLFWPNFKVGIRPNIRPNIRRNLAEYSVSADTNFRPIGRSLLQIDKLVEFATSSAIYWLKVEFT